jgi:hypothetical protein
VNPRAAAGIVALLAVAACGSAKPAPAPPAPPPDANAGYDPGELASLADGVYEVLETMAATVDAHAGDCPGMGRELGELFDKSAPIFARASQVARDPVASRHLAAEMRRHDAESRGLGDRISRGVNACAADPGVQAAIAKMPVF